MKRFKLLAGVIVILAILTSCKTRKSPANDDEDRTDSNVPATVIGGKAGAIVGKQMQAQKEALQGVFPVEATVETVNRGEALKLTFNSAPLFDANSSTLTETGRATLRVLALHLIHNPGICAKIVGYTDGTGRASFNRILSTRRAKSVCDLLTANGVDASRTTFEGKGIRHPVAGNQTEKGRALNRRIEIFIIPGEEMIRNARNRKK
ncbi:MAG: OmpA family protein [Tannerella sp.]|jgi:outer membrane protein OmpA-like peptidoglycan-associated protein|nr:OmpA family protein [Tannerella sp.]